MADKYLHSVTLDVVNAIRKEFGIEKNQPELAVKLADLEERIFKYRGEIISLMELLARETQEEEIRVDNEALSRCKTILGGLLDEYERLYAPAQPKDEAQ